MPSPSYIFLKKVVKQRGYLLKNRIGVCSGQMIAAFEKANNYVNGMAGASDTTVKNWLKRNAAIISELIPGNKGSKKQLDELNNLLS